MLFQLSVAPPLVAQSIAYNLEPLEKKVRAAMQVAPTL